MSRGLSIVMAAVIGFAVSFLAGFIVIPWLRKLKYGQTILEIGPSWHKSKQGTPTMGGLLFIIGTIVASIITVITLYLTKGQLESELFSSESGDTVLFWSTLALAIGQGIVGFTDDYISVVKKRNMGLTAKQKTLGQIIVGLAYLLTLYLSHNTWIYIPFGEKVDLNTSAFGMLVFWFVGIFLIYGFSNAVNLTDGIDGLCGSVTTVVSVAFIVIACLMKFTGMSIIGASVAGSCAGYLIWNHYPAKVFMGDTGSLFLGGAVTGMAFALHCPYILLIIGIVYVCETGSVMLQVSYYKLTKKIFKDKDENGKIVGRRIFKMTPIHHHFEMSGWKENKIVSVFSFVALIGSALGVLIMYYSI